MLRLLEIKHIYIYFPSKHGDASKVYFDGSLCANGEQWL